MSDGKPAVRRASHAGSWYTDNGALLTQQLDKWLREATVTDAAARAIISPHAGYAYSGPSAAFGFKNIDTSRVRRVFVLGPSHHAYLTRCALSSMTEYATPLGNLPIDTAVVRELYATGAFGWMKPGVDEDEHSLEMQLPYLAHLAHLPAAAPATPDDKAGAGGDERPPVLQLVPVLVGSLSKSSEEMYGALFAKYLDDPSNFFVISSDFCHWGKRFDYCYYDPGNTSSSQQPIHKCIEVLDRRGMEAIETQDPSRFYEYQKKYRNTICGRHPIGVFLQTLKASKLKLKLKFVHYKQSSQCVTMDDSSVSYAVACCY